jgi:hypothetical protein
VTLAAASVALCGSLFACAPGPLHRTVTLQSLESAPATSSSAIERHIASDPEALRPLYHPLGRRLGLIVIRNQRDWQQLSRAIPQIGPCPDLSRGMVVGLALEAGASLSGGWPVRWDAVRVYDGAGLIEAHFNPGNYLADGLTCVDTAYVNGLNAVLVVAVDGVRYYPQ